MSLTSVYFFVFVLIALIAYYAIKPLQKYILLVASVYFYIKVSSVSTYKLCMLMLYITLITYLGAIIIDRTKGALKSVVLGFVITALMSALFVLKYAYNLFSVIGAIISISTDFSWIQFASVIGISYYALSAMGYVIDVYWENYEAEKNPVNVGLFIFYFPQLISGPFTRYSEMKDQINDRTSLNYENITYGIRRMIWGYFKKLVISERFGIIVSAVYGDYNNFSFIGIVGATLCYAVQLYTDFSGCMDIIMGCSTLFGITLPENFKAPFFSESIQEFWQRWHITLGKWFKDYFMYPVQKSKPVQNLGKVVKKLIGKKKGKKAPFYISMLMLWVLIGIWHGGTGYYFIASAGVPCVLLILSDMLQPLFKNLIKILRINTECESWHWFRRIRTLLLICICWVIACSNGTHNAISIIRHMISDLWNYTTFTSTMETFGINTLDVAIMIIGIVLLYITDKLVYEGTTVFKALDKQNFIVKILVIYAELLTILFHGKRILPAFPKVLNMTAAMLYSTDQSCFPTGGD